MNKLKQHVNEWLTEQAKEYDNGKQGVVKDLQHGGCQSGFVSHLIYYNDTLKFYQDYKEEINELLTELIESTGLSIGELFGDKYDKEDPLCLDTNNQNLLAWFGFEETAFNLANELELEY